MRSIQALNQQRKQLCFCGGISAHSSGREITIRKQVETAAQTQECFKLLLDGCQSGRLGTPGKRVYRKVPRVRIPPHPFFRFADERRCGIITQIAESALHASPVIKYVAVYETAAMFIVSYSSGYRRGARFDLLYEPGGRWSGFG